MTKLFHVESTAAHRNLAIQHGDPKKVLFDTRAFLSECGLELSKVVSIACQHTSQVTHVTSDNCATTIPTEALITSDPSVVLFLLTGDCFPVSYHDPINNVIALAHLGWKPTDKRLAEKVVQEMIKVYGSNPADIEVYIGSGISQDSYVFDTAVQKGKPGWEDFVIDLPNGQVSVDLSGYITQQLNDSGILTENISYSPIDTAVSPERFSHYRSVRTNEPQGRFATVVTLRA